MSSSHLLLAQRIYFRELPPILFGHHYGMRGAEAGDTAAQAFSGTRYIMFSNIFQRACTFCLNQIMVRSSGPEIFGLASVELELLLSTLLYLSRYLCLIFVLLPLIRW